MPHVHALYILISIFVVVSHRYLLFHSPGDVCYQFAHWQPVYIVLMVVKELRRAHSVRLGMKIAKEVYRDRWLVHMVAGLLKGLCLDRRTDRHDRQTKEESSTSNKMLFSVASGTRWAKTVDQIIRGSPRATEHELIKPSS